MNIIVSTKLNEFDEFDDLDGKNISLESIDSPIFTLESLFEKIVDALNICKTDILIKFIMLMSYPKFFGVTSVKENDFTAFFIPKNLIPEMMEKNTDISRYVERDSYVYNTLMDSVLANKAGTSNDEVIFIYQLFLTFTKQISKYIDTDIQMEEMITLINKAITTTECNLNSIKGIYFALKSNPLSLNKSYTDLVQKKKKISTFIKFRNDDKLGLANPRYNIRFGENNLMLVEYMNIDGKFGFAPAEDDDGVQPKKTAKKVAATPAAAPLKKIVSSYNHQRSDADLQKRAKKEIYVLGEFDRVYPSKDDTAKTITNTTEIKELVDKLIINEENLCIIGFGQSGSGKTSVLIYYTKAQEDGIIMELCKLPEFTNTFSSITIEFQNIYTYHWMKRESYNSYEEFEYKISPIGETTAFDFKIVDPENPAKNYWYTKTVKEVEGEEVEGEEEEAAKTEVKEIKLGEFIMDAFEEREVESTTNNRDSSRSHVICCLTCTRKDGKEARKIIICDLAGVENKFDITLNSVLKFDYQYTQSQKYENKDINFDTFFCSQKLPADGARPDDDSSVSSLEDDDSSLSHSSSNSSVSSYSTTSSSESESESESDDEYGDGADYESSDGFLQDMSIYRDLMDGGISRWKGINYNLSDYPYGGYLDEKASTIQEHATDIAEMDVLLENETKTEPTIPANGDCLDRYTLPTCQKLNLRKGETGPNIATTIEILANKLELQKRQVRYYKNMLSCITKLNKMEFPNLPEDDANAIIAKFKTNGTEVEYTDDDRSEKTHQYLLETRVNVDPTMFLAVLYEYGLKNYKVFQDKDRKAIINPLFNLGPKRNKKGVPIETKQDDFIKQITSKETLDNFTQNYNLSIIEFYRCFCNKHRFNKLLFNMRLRINEGMMINHSLAELRKDIKSILLNSVSLKTGTDKVYLPIVYDNVVSPAIRNTYLEDDYFENFIEKSASNKNGKQPIVGQIMLLIKNQFKVDIDAMHIGLFTVINLTDDGTINNPPNPPYINISSLIYHLPTTKGGMSRHPDISTIVSLFMKMINETGNYEFYKSNDMYNEIKDKAIAQLTQYISSTQPVVTQPVVKVMSAKARGKVVPPQATKPAEIIATKPAEIIVTLPANQDFINGVYEPFIKNFVELIQQNNPSSLMGSLESTDILRSFTFNKIIGYYNMGINAAVFNKYKSFGLEYYNSQFKEEKTVKILSDIEYVKKVALTDSSR